MKNLFTIVTLSLLVFLSCNKKGEDIPAVKNGVVNIVFDNIAVVGQLQKQLKLSAVGGENYDFKSGLGQDFNVTLLRYFISKIVLEGPNGERYEDEISVSATGAKGFYLVDENDFDSQLITLSDVPAGEYNKVSFTVGIDEEGVKEGAAGGVLDPATNGMFWNWNAGYVALKFEGQSPVAAGGANGNTITPDNAKGLVFHVGGWKEVKDTPFVYNNKRLSYTFYTSVKVNSEKDPYVHMVFDVLKMLAAKNMIDFTGNNNVHKPIDGVPIAENLEAAFQFDHIHQ
ncbi:MAG: MbnP family protein [Saprospiraceae bacterium]